MSNSLKLPCLKGRIGDWYYYVSLMNFKDLAERTSMVPEIHQNQALSNWIQREVSDRTEDIVSYLLEQKQRFFNSIIFGLYGGKPQWQEIDIENKAKTLTEEEVDYFSRTFGVLNLSGEEKIFAIDGQHRTKAIKDAIKQNPDLGTEEVSVIFVAHKKTLDGEIRTRRLFSTLNRYAAPVTPSEIIALDEEDNCAILTRKLIEESTLFRDKILFSKNKSLSVKNTSAFTNIILLYDIITILLTDQKVLNIRVSGHPKERYISRRNPEDEILKDYKQLETFFTRVITAIPSLNSFFFTNNEIDRENKRTSLLFRPIGQLIMFSVLKVAQENKKLKKAIDFFALDNFNIQNRVWKQIFFDSELGVLKTEKSLQKYAIQLILKHLNIDVILTKKEKSIFDNFNIDHSRIA